MLTEFELLIRELESEKLILDEELQECLTSQDYKYADYFQKGIWRIERKIDRLKQLNRNPTSLDTQHLADAIIETSLSISIDSRTKGFIVKYPQNGKCWKLIIMFTFLR